GLTNILLSGDEPFSYGKAGTTKVLEDLRGLVLDRKLVDLWFWGNTHYCALFGSSTAFPFVGSCIGHGGFPYAKLNAGGPSVAPIAFLETGARFPDWTGVRQDRGANGYCRMTLHGNGDITLMYVDWMKRDRCRARLTRAADGRLTLSSTEVF